MRTERNFRVDQGMEQMGRSVSVESYIPLECMQQSMGRQCYIIASLRLSRDLIFHLICPNLKFRCRAMCSLNAFHVSRDAEAFVVNDMASMTAGIKIC